MFASTAASAWVLFVDTRSDHDHPSPSLQIDGFSFDSALGGHALLGAIATLLLGHASGPGWQRTTQRTSVRPMADRQTKSQPVTSPGPNPACRTTQQTAFLPASHASGEPAAATENQLPVPGASSRSPKGWQQAPLCR